MKITRKQLRQIIKESIMLEVRVDPIDKADTLDTLGKTLVGGGAVGAVATGTASSGPIGLALGMATLTIYLGWLSIKTSAILEVVSDNATLNALNSMTIRMLSPALKKARAEGAVNDTQARAIRRQMMTKSKGGGADLGNEHIGKIIPYVTKLDWTRAVMSMMSQSDGDMINEKEFNEASKIIWNATLDAKNELKKDPEGWFDKTLRALGLD